MPNIKPKLTSNTSKKGVKDTSIKKIDTMIDNKKINKVSTSKQVKQDPHRSSKITNKIDTMIDNKKINKVSTSKQVKQDPHRSSKITNKIDKTNKIENTENNNSILKFNQLDEYAKMFKFKTLSSGIIRADVMHYAIKNLDRKAAIFSLERYISIGIADIIEHGVLEFTLIQISSEASDVIEFTSNIYKSKINDICVNLDPNNKRINNQSLRGSLIEGGLDPHFVAFMNPRQLHPARWSKELDKQRNIEDANNNKKVTDIYKCRICHDRKSTTTQMQTRSADEPMTIFVTCLTCYNTFTTQ